MDMGVNTISSKVVGFLASRRSSWYIGVFLSLVASFIGALGDNIVRLSYITEEKRQRKHVRPLYKRPLWVIGEIFTIVCNPAMTLCALKFAAASIVVPFGGLHIFWNVCLCGYLLRERLSRAEIIGSLIILFGIILVVSFGTHVAMDYPVDRLINLFGQPVFIFYSVLAFFIICGFLYFSQFGIIETVKDLVLYRDQAQLRYDPESNLSRFCIAALSGFCGGNGNLLAKAVIEAINAEGANVWLRYEFYLIALATGILCGVQALSLTISLGRYEAKFVVPMVNSWLVASGSTGGMLLFQEYDDLSVPDMVIFSIGVSSVILGILVLMKGGTHDLSIEKLMTEDETANLIAHEASLLRKGSRESDSEFPSIPLTGASSDSASS